MRRLLLCAAVAAAVALAILGPVTLLASTASCSLVSSSFAEAVLNTPTGEDTDFFVTSNGGVPNVMFLLDTSGSMQRLAPDGAADTWGSFERAGNTTAGAGFGCTNAYGNALVYASPCGTTTLEGSPYNPTPGSANPNVYSQAKDASGNYCPYLVSGNQPPATNKPGFDPDFYPQFFADGLVDKDSSWSDTQTYPEPETSVANFCARSSFTAGQQTSCGACMRDQGYWFDGTYQAAAWNARACAMTDDCSSHGEGVCVQGGVEHNDTSAGAAKTGTCRLPNVYFSGNFLNFNPPKFVMARKVLKDVITVVKRVRMGLTILNGSSGGTLVSALNPPCNLFGSPSQFDSNRGSLLSLINNTNKVSFDSSTPLAETLLEIGQFYRSSATSGTALSWFNGTYQASGWDEKSGQNKSVCFSCQASAALIVTDGLPNRDQRIPGTDFSSAPMTAVVANQAGSYAGMGGYNITGISTTDCPACESWAELADTSLAPGTCNGNQDSGACDDSGNPIVSYLPRVAWYLKNLDFRNNGEIGSDGLKFTGKQAITTYTIGLGTRGAATKILQDTATAGGGLFNGGTGAAVTNAKTLRDAILGALQDVNTRSTSFGAASFSTLQTSTTQGVLVPRFEPARTAHWDGHLYAFDLFSEFTSGTCFIPANPATSGPANGDYDCDGKCNSVFLKDADGSFIQEDGTGTFKKNLNRSLAACGNGSLCGSANCSGPDPSASAVPFWDAGSKLAPIKKSVDASTGIVTESPNTGSGGFASGRLDWNLRKLFTVIDRDGDGKFTAADMPLVDLRTADPATLVPYLNIQGSKWCSTLSAQLAGLGNPAGATIDAEVAAGTYTTCAKLLLYYIRGADIFNERNGDPACASYPSPTNPTGTYCTRKYQLGDIFHSSPIEVWPPLASDGFACPRSLNNQCSTSLFSPSIPNPSATTNANAYDDYSKSTRYKARHKFALVGANDGILHAFQIERTVGGATNPYAGEEIWGFIPPDLLAKLRLLLGTTHQFYVDATPMVRDVWIDGPPLNKISGGGSGTVDGIRTGDEFHTVAVVGERRGGTHYFALDITDASDDLDAKPSFMWLYPQPNDPEELQFGETFSDFAPKPPPIGPVRLDRGAPPCSGNYQTYTGPGGTRCFEERWVTFLSGGFDPQYTRGRGVHMVDLATGAEVFDFSQPPGTGATCGSGSDPRCKLNYPVAGTVAMMAWGSHATFTLNEASSGYYDTATFGDTGGQLWVVRFADPGQGFSASTGTKVTNWFGGRIFQNGLTSSTPACGLDYCGGQPFFYITSNVALPSNGLYRVLAGTGDRFNLLDPLGGVCGPDNLRACLLKGCTVTLKDPSGNPGAVYGVQTLLGTQSYGMNGTALCSAVPVAQFTYSTSPATAGGTCSTITQSINGLTISCPSSVTCSGVAETTTKTTSVKCSGNACDATASNDFGSPISVRGNPDKTNAFYSLQVFAASGPRGVFRTAADALAYDQARLSDSTVKDVTAYDTNPVPANLASPDDPGWKYTFSHGATASSGAVTVSIGGVTYNIFRTDERNASVSAVEQGCSFWNTIQTATPVGAYDATTDCPINSPCKAGRAQTSYLYGADPGTGGLCLFVNGAAARSQRNDTLVPPQMGKLVAYVAGGQVAFGLTSVRVPQGGANVMLGAAQDLATQLDWLPIDRNLHDCRHAQKRDPGTGLLTPPTPDKCQ